MSKKLKIAKLITEPITPVLPDDPIAEAGRKVLQGEFLKILQHEPGSRTGEDIEDVHKMRVAIRQTRSAFLLLGDYYKARIVQDLQKNLRDIARVLGTVRDLDVMIFDLSNFNGELDEYQTKAMHDVIEALDQRRVVARKKLVRLFDSKPYRQFMKSYASFLNTPKAGALSFDDLRPIQVRHVLPPLVHNYLAAVRAYDPALPDAEIETLHALRIEFKRLRYITTLFSGILGKDIEAYIAEVKLMQDHLGRLNDIDVAKAFLQDLMDDLEGDQVATLWVYINYLEAELPTLIEAFPPKWQHFNTRSVQRKLANALLVL